MQSLSLAALLLLAGTHLASARVLASRSLEHFERRYISSLEYAQPNGTLKLIGFQTVQIPPHTQPAFAELYSTYSEHDDYAAGYNSAHYDFESGSLRVYFPVAGALVRHRGSFLEANALGEIEVEDLNGNYHVQGRYQTEQTHGHAGNIVKDGVVYLGKPCPPSHAHGNVHVYDFGPKSLDHDHDHAHSHGEVHGQLHRRQDEEQNGDGSEEQTNQGCVANHGGINCSKAYGIDNGRCPFNPDTCMDYNGYMSNTLGSCKKEDKYLYFVGSDCFDSVKQGNCWNEMVAAA